MYRPGYISDISGGLGKNGVLVVESGDHGRSPGRAESPVDYSVGPLVGHPGAAAEGAERCCRAEVYRQRTPIALGLGGGRAESAEHQCCTCYTKGGYALESP